jgi:hypothetical protein
MDFITRLDLWLCGRNTDNDNFIQLASQQDERIDTNLKEVLLVAKKTRALFGEDYLL